MLKGYSGLFIKRQPFTTFDKRCLSETCSLKYIILYDFICIFQYSLHASYRDFCPDNENVRNIRNT